MKKFLSIFLIIAMLMGCMPAAALSALANDPTAQTEGTDGPSNDIPLPWGDGQGAPAVENVVYFEGHYYKVFDGEVSWEAASMQCQSLGGHLATITTAAEQAFITAISNLSVKPYLWLGGLSSVPQSLDWITGEPVSHTNWVTGAYSTYDNTAYLMMYTHKSDKTIGQWNAIEEKWNATDEPEQNNDKYGYICEWDNEKSMTDPKAIHSIRVLDSQSRPIANAKVVATQGTVSREGTTNAFGFYNLEKDGFADEAIAVTITADGYQTYEDQLSESGFNTFMLFTPEEAKYMLPSVIYCEGVIDRHVADITETYVRVSKTLAPFDGRFLLLCQRPTAESLSDAICSFSLYQGKTLIALSGDGIFSLRATDFAGGKNFYIRTMTVSGKTMTTPLKLEICNDGIPAISKLSFGDEEFSFKLDESIPLLGGSELTFGMPDSPIEFEVEKGRIYVGLNTDLSADDDDNDVTAEPVKNRFDELMNAIESMQEFSSYKKDSPAAKRIESFLKKKEVYKVPVLGEVDISLVGAGELTWTENGLSQVTLHACLIIDVTAKGSWHTVIYSIPVTIQLEAGLETTLKPNITYNFVSDTFSGEVDLKLKPHVELFLGVGFDEIAGAGIYGSVELDILIKLQEGLNSIVLSGEAGVEGYIGDDSIKFPIIQRPYELYPLQSAARRAAIVQPQYTDVFNASKYTLSDLSYLSKQSAWWGERTKQARKTVGDTTGNVVIRPLQDHTYRNMQPTLAASSEDAVMVFINADTNRTDGNTSVAMYSVYDALTETWSAPIQVDDNLTTDTAPTLYSDGDTIRLLYQDAATEYGEGRTHEEYLTTQNVVVYAFDETTDTFVREATFATDGKQYRKPTLSTVNGVPMVMWLACDGADLLGQNGTNHQILYSSYQDGAWSEASVWADNVGTIYDYAVGEANDAPSVVCAVDGDGNFATEDDRKLIQRSADGAVELLSGTVGNLCYTQLPSENAKTFVWFSDDGMHTLRTDGTIQSVCAISDAESFTILGNKILFTAAGDADSEIFAVVYDATTGTYSAPVQLSEQNEYIERLSGATFRDQELLLMVRKAITHTDSGVESDCELAWATVNPQADLTIQYVEHSHASIQDNLLPVFITVANNGTVTADGYTVSLKDSDGNVVVEQSFDEPFYVGDTKNVTLMLPLDTITSLEDYTVVVGHAANASDDTETTTIGYGDLEISTEIFKFGNQNTLVCTVKNVGLSAISGRLKVTDNATSHTLANATIDRILPGESRICVIDVNSQAEESILNCVVTANEPEYSTVNNTEEVYADFSVFVDPGCEHVYDNVCDAFCNGCGEERTEDFHVFDDPCDATCNDCDAQRVPPHVYADRFDADCDICGQVREVDNNLLINGDFETGDLTGWENVSDACDVKFVEGYESNYAIDISANAWGSVRQTGIVVEPNTDYILSARVKDASHFMLYVTDTDNSHVASHYIESTADWQQVVMSFNSGDQSEIFLRLMSDSDNGHAIFDDIRLTKDDSQVPDTPGEVIYGDANGDGSVNNLDVALLQRYLNNWDVTVNEASADANGDGSINNLDVALLQRYLNNWGVILGPDSSFNDGELDEW